MSKPETSEHLRALQSSWAAACEHIIHASQEAEEILKPMVAISALFRLINFSGIDLSCQFEDSDLDAIPKESTAFFDICCFVLSEAGLMRQVAKRILQIQGAQPFVVKDMRREEDLRENQNEPTLTQLMRQVSDISQKIAEAAGAMIGKDPNYTCQEACGEIISRTCGIDGLLLDFIERIWQPSRSLTKSEHDVSIENFKTIRELALECEAQFEETIDVAMDVDIDKVTRNTNSIKQLAQQILNQHRAPAVGQMKLTEEKFSDIFGVIVDVVEEVMLCPETDRLAACMEIIHATHKIQEMLLPPGRPPVLRAKKMTLEENALSSTAGKTTAQLRPHRAGPFLKQLGECCPVFRFNPELACQWPC